MQKLLLIIFFFSCMNSDAQIQWMYCYGGIENEDDATCYQTSDGGYIISATSGSQLLNGLTGNYHGYFDMALMKVDANGYALWSAHYGGTNLETCKSSQQTSDGGFILGGSTFSNDGDVTGFHGLDADLWFVKTDQNGNLQWQKCLGGSRWDDGYSVRESTDGGYFIVGIVQSTDGDVTGSLGFHDIWVVKLNSVGNIIWQKCLGGSYEDWGYAVRETPGGGCIITGGTASTDGNVTGNHGGMSDLWVVQLDSSGTIEWQKCYGGTSADGAYCINRTSDGGYIIGGTTQSNDGDVSGYHGMQDAWIIKIDAVGNLQWQRCLGGTSDDVALSVCEATFGGYLVAVKSYSNNGDVVWNYGLSDYWVVVLDPYGNHVDWQMNLGGSSNDFPQSIAATTDGGLIIAGSTISVDGDVIGPLGNGDIWAVKMDNAVGVSNYDNFYGITTFPNPADSRLNVYFQGTYSGDGTIYLKDLMGREVSSPISFSNLQELQKLTIPTSDLNNGIYLLQVECKEKLVNKKILVRHN